MAVLLIIL